MKWFIPGFLPAAIALVSGCGQAFPPLNGVGTAEQVLEVELPGLPIAFASREVVWELRWWNGTSIERETIVAGDARVPQVLELAASERGAECVVVEAVATVLDGRVRLEPWGGWLYPPDRTCALSHGRGVLAGILIDLGSDRLDPSLVNAERLQTAIMEECDADPAWLDRNRLEEGLRSLAFRRYHIRRRERPGVEVRLPLPGTGGVLDWAWNSGSPLEPLVVPAIAGEYIVWSIPVAPGETRTFWRQGPSEVMQKMTLHRTVEGHASWHIYELPLEVQR